MITRREFMKLGAAVGGGLLLPVGAIEKAMAYSLLGQAPPADPLGLTKYVDKLPIPGAMPTAGSSTYYEVGAFPLTSRVHRQMPATKAWGYRPMGWKPGVNPEATYLGPSFVVKKGTPTRVKWFNELKDGTGEPIPHPLPVDPSLDWAAPDPSDNMMMGPFPVGGDGTSTFDYTLDEVPLVPHVHGAEVEPQSDGGPNNWFTPDWEHKGASWSHKIYRYANSQPEATIWYHDHAMGLTRLNVYMGLAGAYVVTDPAHAPKGLPKGVDRHGVPLDIPLVIQDRMFDTDGQLYFPAISNNPDVNPFWVPEFFGDHILVNGKAWPYLDVEPRAYRFRLLNGSNARFYSMWLAYAGSPSRRGPGMFQIATDGGYMHRPVRMTGRGAPAPGRLTMGPGERCEVIVDFSNYVGRTLRLYNNAAAPAPDGDPVDERTTAQIMEFRVRKMPAKHYTFPKNPLNPALRTFPSLDKSKSVRTRILTLNEVATANGPVKVMVNLTNFAAPVTERPVVGSTEIWKIVNTTGDTHPIHTHLTQFQLLGRQPFDHEAYEPAFAAANGTLPLDGIAPNADGFTAYTPVDPAPYYAGPFRPWDRNERGWKDTVRMSPGEVTTILVRFAPIDGTSDYGFDPTHEPGYVWHCHIVDHEDNEMMRPYKLIEESDPT
jgi:spore coat protein A, manganese oxidase